MPLYLIGIMNSGIGHPHLQLFNLGYFENENKGVWILLPSLNGLLIHRQEFR